jgi:hypothetical protein
MSRMERIRNLITQFTVRSTGRDPARRCRVCREPIELDDYFGLSEMVCRPCRGEQRRAA